MTLLVVLVATFLLVLVLAAVLGLLVLLWFQRRPTAAPPVSPSGLSPDGNWWWDGTQWLPSGRSVTPPTSPAP